MSLPIIRYSNRLEIRNPGYSLVPEERLGEPGSITRNPKIAAVLHDVGLAETKGTGIRAMREALERANLTQPLFESDRVKDEFTVRLLVHHLLGPQDWDWLAQFKDCSLSDDDARALIVARELGAIDNTVCRAITHLDTLAASGILRRLRDHDLLGKKGSGSATYYVPTGKLLGAGATGRAPAAKQPTAITERVLGEPAARAPTGATGLSEGLNPIDKAQSMGLGPLPEGLTEAVQAVGERTGTSQIREVIYKLCSWKELQPSHLSALLGRNQTYLVNRHLRPMVAEGLLEYAYPDNPAHPKQAYRAKAPVKPEQ